MVRPRKSKIVSFEPNITYFKPQGVPLRDLETETISIDELEALRLSNIERLNQTQAAKRMEVHQSTFHRILARAYEKITIALVKGKAIAIGGGNYSKAVPSENVTSCVCPRCGTKKEHVNGVPCNSEMCPKCGTSMMRSSR